MGVQGPNVAMSATGAQLAQGPAGPIGPQGLTGPAGQQGPAGTGTAGQVTNSLSPGLNSDIPTSGLPTLRLGAGGAFSLGGFAVPGGAQQPGYTLAVVNTTAFPMSIVHEDTSSQAANRISVPGGVTTTQLFGGGTAVFVYDAGASPPGTGRWSLQNQGVHRPVHWNIKDAGAVPGGPDISGPINATIASAAAAAGGTVFVPSDNVGDGVATYVLGSTMHVGASGTATSGVTIQAARRSLGQSQALFQWAGASGGTMLEVREAHSCVYDRVSFNAAAQANYCVQFHYVPADGNLQVEHHDVRDAYFANARVYNELIGEPDGSPSSGDASLILHTNCYYQQAASAGTATTAHVRHRSINALGNGWLSCQFYGNGTYPQYGIRNGGGSIWTLGCVADVLGAADYYIDNDAGIAPGNCVVIAHEAQSHRLLLTSTDGTYAIRSTVLMGCFHDDIFNGGDPLSINWDVPGPALVLIGNALDVNGNGSSGGDVRVDRPTCSVESIATSFFYPGKGFKGYVERVSGTYRDSSGDNHRLRTQYETTGWGMQQDSAVSAVVIGSGAAFNTITNGEYVNIGFNGLPTQQVTFTVPGDTTATAVLNTINTLFGSSGVNGYPANVDPATGAQLCLRASLSVQLAEGSAGTLTKLGLVAGTTTAPANNLVAQYEGKHTALLSSSGATQTIGTYEMCGMLIVASNGGIGTGGTSCIFQLQGGASPSVHKESTDPGSQFSTTKNTASKVNVYWDSGTGMFTLQNNLSNLQFAFQFLGIGQH